MAFVSDFLQMAISVIGNGNSVVFLFRPLLEFGNAEFLKCERLKAYCLIRDNPSVGPRQILPSGIGPYCIRL